MSELHPELRYDGSYKTSEELQADFRKSNKENKNDSDED